MPFAFGSTVFAFHEYNPFDFFEPRMIALERLTIGDYIQTPAGIDKITNILTYDCPGGLAYLSTVFGLRATADVVINFGTTWREMNTVTPVVLQSCNGLVCIETELYNKIEVDGVQCITPHILQADIENLETSWRTTTGF
jgi:hypothetical protein